MKWSICLFFFLAFTFNCFSQTEQSLKNYFEQNANILDPIEGIYDVETHGDYVTPIVHQKFPKDYMTFYIVKGNTNNRFDVYVKTGDLFGDSYYSLERIGNSNAYRSYFHTTSTRVILKDSNHFTAELELDNPSAKKFLDTNRLSPSVQITLYLDCIKVFP